MAIIKCKMCGGDVILSEDKTFGTCDHCGSTMTFPKVSDDQRAAAFNRGNHFRRMGEFDKALAVYERIVAEDDDDSEAHWCCALCRFGIEYVEDPATYEWLPTCHRASFDSFLEDVDYLAAVEHSDGITRRQYQKDAAKIAEVQRGILSTSQNTEPYDVFISYKELDAEGNRTRDSILAQDIYYQLTEKGWRVFFSRISLEDVPGTQYEPYIFAALNSAKVMIVVGTSAENLNAVWVKNEWSRYLSLMRKDRSKLLLPCYRDMDPYDLPEQLSVLMSYDMGKIGFIQDLIRGVDKVLNAEKPKEAAPAPASAPVQERVIVQQTGGGPNVTALLKRGQQALEDGDWDKARGFYDQVLSMDAENAEAFLGLALAGSRSRDTQAYLNDLSSITPSKETRTLNLDMAHRKTVIEKSVVPGYCDESELSKFYDFKVNYPSVKNSQQSLVQEARARFDSDRNLNRAFRYASGESKQRLDALKKELNDRLNAQIKAAELSDQKALEQAKAELAAKTEAADRRAEELSRTAQEKREADYQAACRVFDEAKTILQFRNAAGALDALKTYKDSAEKKAKAIKIAEDMEKEEQEAKAKTAAAQAKKQKKIFVIAMAVVLVCGILAIVYSTVIVPNRAKKAVVDQYYTLFAAFEANDGWAEVDAVTDLLDENAAPNEVFKEVLKAAESGDPYAEYLASYCYSTGASTEKDDALAFQWAQKSADHGNSYGINILGVCFINGQGVLRDVETGLSLYLQAAEMGNPVAMNNLGNCYRIGKHVAQDYEKAMEWYRKAADEGHPGAICTIGTMYYVGDGVTQDYTEAFNCFLTAANQGVAVAMNNVGAMYINGEGVTQDYAKAREWLLKGADAGDAEAMNTLGKMYKYGLGVTKNEELANQWFRKAKDAGYSE